MRTLALAALLLTAGCIEMAPSIPSPPSGAAGGAVCREVCADGRVCRAGRCVPLANVRGPVVLPQAVVPAGALHLGIVPGGATRADRLDLSAAVATRTYPEPLFPLIYELRAIPPGPYRLVAYLDAGRGPSLWGEVGLRVTDAGKIELLDGRSVEQLGVALFGFERR
jgi:hypothetical protein